VLFRTVAVRRKDCVRTGTPTVAKNERARYSTHVKDQVRKRYGLCRTTADKQALADELGIGSVPKLYNLASRLGATGKESATSLSWSAAHEEARHLEREDPDTIEFTSEADRYLRSEFGRRTPEAISFHLHHTETALLYRARHLGLRQPVKLWDIVKVAKWFGMTLDEFRELAREGIDIHPLGNRDSKLVREVATTTSLGRWMQDDANLASLRSRGADEFFIREILESIDDILNQRIEWERCKFLTHGHVCQNTYSMNSFGLFCPNSDRHRAGEDPSCMVRTLSIEDLRPDQPRG
jgi:hypothetical protein